MRDQAQGSTWLEQHCRPSSIVLIVYDHLTECGKHDYAAVAALVLIYDPETIFAMHADNTFAWHTLTDVFG